MPELTQSLAGRILGNWRLDRLLGAGSFGAVYLASHVRIEGSQAAIKILHPHIAAREAARQRFLSEAIAASRAAHENIIRVFDEGQTEDGLCYLVMEYLQGDSLAKLLRAGPLDVKRTLSIAHQVAAALEAAHRQKVVHRDLKPENIFVLAREHGPELVKVLDFGIAKLLDTASQTAEGSWLGTPAYMAPEQWHGGKGIDGRADLYALGVILFECLTGQRPFSGNTPVEWMTAHLTQSPPGLLTQAQVPEALKQLVHGLLAKDPAQRPQDAAAVMQVLSRLRSEGSSLEHAGPAAAEPGPALSARPAARSLAGVLGGVVILGAVGLGGFIMLRNHGSKGAGNTSQAAAPPEQSITQPTAQPRSGLVGEDKEPTRSSHGADVRPAAPTAPDLGAQPLLPPDFVYFAGRDFRLGSSSDDPGRSDYPAHVVHVEPFVIGRFEVSTAEYAKYYAEQDLTHPAPWGGADWTQVRDRPAIMLTRREAQAYCASRYPEIKGRLPTEKEWELAARSGREAQEYPWPGYYEPSRAYGAQDPRSAPSLLGVRDASYPGQTAQGAFHMVGNAAEWTRDNAYGYPGSPLRPHGNLAVVRGGSMISRPAELSATARAFVAPDARSPYIGFRCAGSAAQPQ